jgi:hypothetical protein
LSTSTSLMGCIWAGLGLVMVPLAVFTALLVAPAGVHAEQVRSQGGSVTCMQMMVCVGDPRTKGPLLRWHWFSLFALGLSLAPGT